jgi:hypothetical protein
MLGRAKLRLDLCITVFTVVQAWQLIAPPSLITSSASHGTFSTSAPNSVLETCALRRGRDARFARAAARPRARMRMRASRALHARPPCVYQSDVGPRSCLIASLVLSCS